MGIEKAPVLPDPVLARPITSRPSSAGGLPSSCWNSIRGLRSNTLHIYDDQHLHGEHKISRDIYFIVSSCSNFFSGGRRKQLLVHGAG